MNDWSEAKSKTAEHGEMSLLVSQLSRGLDLLSPTTNNPEKNYDRVLALMKLKAKVESLIHTYEHAADELGD
jgi:hypothetical protein